MTDKQLLTRLSVILLISIGLTTFGTWVDSDPEDNVSPIFEFIMGTLFVSFIISSIYFSIIAIRRLLLKK